MTGPHADAVKASIAAHDPQADRTLAAAADGLDDDPAGTLVAS
jgi:hypothetical protein